MALVLVVAPLGVVILAVFCAIGLTSLREGEKRAAGIAFGIAVVASLPFFLSLLLPAWVQAEDMLLAVESADYEATLAYSTVNRRAEPTIYVFTLDGPVRGNTG